MLVKLTPLDKFRFQTVRSKSFSNFIDRPRQTFDERHFKKCILFITHPLTIHLTFEVASDLTREQIVESQN